MGRDSFPLRMKEENERSCLERLLFREVWLLTYQLLPDSWSILSFAEHERKSKHLSQKLKIAPANTFEFSLGNFAVPEPPPCTSIGTCSCWWRHYLEVSFEFLSFWFSLCGNTPRLNLWRKHEKKGKLDAIVTFISLLNCLGENEDRESFLMIWKILISLEKLLAKVEIWWLFFVVCLTDTHQNMLPAF